jgi:amino acid adenylation domain-containing protein/non-ribosomal peptide synthase protein (TIGR01720 family)
LLAGIIGEVLGVKAVGIYDNFFEIGGDSILGIQVLAKARRSGIKLTPQQLFHYQTVAGLATVAVVFENAAARQAPVAGPSPLTPIQRWFFEQNLESPHHFNQAVMLDLLRPVAASTFEAAFRQLLNQHDALRLRFNRERDTWRQIIADRDEHLLVAQVDLSGLSEDQQMAALETTAAQVQASLDIFAGPLARAVLFDRGTGKRVLALIVIHHLAVDAVSWHILLEDLETAIGQASNGLEIVLPTSTTSYVEWSRALSEHALGRDIEKEIPYWTAETRKEQTRLSLEDDRNIVGAAQTLVFSLDQEETRAIVRQIPASHKAQVTDLLLAALAEAFVGVTGRRRLLVELEGHGREAIKEGIDLSRTVGWFTAIFPVCLNIEGASTPDQLLNSIKEQLRQVPNRGVGYGMLRYLSDDPAMAERLDAFPQAELSFNYLGHVDAGLRHSSLFEVSAVSAGPMRDLRQKRAYLIEINAGIVGGQLVLHWIYNTEQVDRRTIQEFADGFIASLKKLMAHCMSAAARGYIPSDFPLACLDQQQIDNLLTDSRPLEDVYPLSPMQKGMLFHDLYTPESGVYCIQLTCSLHGEFDQSAFDQAWQTVVDCHPVLRTSFVSQGLSEPLQIVHAEARCPVAHFDWRELSLNDQQQQFAEHLRAARRRGFDHHRPPLMNLAVMRTGEKSFKFIWNSHHILMDGWSRAVILKDVFEIYEALRRGDQVSSEPGPPYRDYIAWLKQQDLSEAETFWRQQLDGFTEPTPFHIDKPRESASAEEEIYKEVDGGLSEAATARLRKFGRRHQLTLNTIVQGAWAILLSRYSGLQDVVFGSVVSGRPTELAGVEEMVGLFINTLPVRAQVTPNARVVDWLKRLQTQQADMRQYEFTPLVEVQGWSAMSRNLTLFESILTFENYPVDEEINRLVSDQQGPLKIAEIRSEERTNYPLNVWVIPAQTLAIKLGYDEARFDAEPVRRMLGHLTTLLEAMAADEDRRLYSLPILTEAEQKDVLARNQTRTATASEKCLHELFEAQVERNPEGIALVFGTRRLTYAELNVRANQLAHYLRTLSVGPDTLVGLCVERSIDLIVGLLGIIKAGGAYVPLDPSYPQPRLHYMLEDSQAQVLILQQAMEENLPDNHVRRVYIDSGWELIARQSTDNLDTRVTADNLAYVIYTSGSTGLPKGISIPIRGITRLVLNTDYIDIQPGERLAQASNASFDAATFEIFGALLNGAQLVGVAKDVALSLNEFAGQIAEHGITTLFLTTALFNQIANQAPGLFSTLKHVLFGGELVDPRRVREVLEKGRPERLLHVYGPTESTTFASWYEVRQMASDAATVPIGRPLANTEIYLLDESLQPVVTGVPGELYIGGPGLARGYLNRPELTAEKFVPHPFSTTPGARLYRSGDQARYLAGGDIEFIGRQDQQIKLRGYRIEIGEIEAALLSHAAVREAVVQVEEGASGERRLVGYVGVSREAAVKRRELRDYLKERLPEYMVPGRLVVLDRLPLNANGKVDREELREAGGAEAEEDEEGRGGEARGAVEELLAGIIGEVLGVKAVGIYDNFFEIGGHSLHAIQVSSRMREVFRVEIPLRDLFEFPVVTQLAERVEAAMRRGSGLEAPPILPTPKTDEVPLSFAQQRLWFFDQLSPGNPFYNIFVAFRLAGHLDRLALEQSLNEIVRRHHALRTTFHLSEGRPLQAIAGELRVALPVTDLGYLPAPDGETAARRLASEEAQQPFDLAQGPLFRARLLRLGDQDHIALFTIHHIVSDGWSMDVFMRELVTSYNGLANGLPSSLEPLPIQYADFAIWQREWLSTQVLEEHLGYWRRQLQGCPPRLELATDYPRRAIQDFKGAKQPIAISGVLAASLKELSRNQNVTLFMTLLAAFDTLLYRWTGQDDINVGSPAAGRNRIETESLIGFFVNTLVLRSDLSGDPTFADMLSRVRETVFMAQAYQGLPFEKLVEELQPERNLSHTPLFQVMLVVQNTPQKQLELSGLTLEPLDVDSGTAKFDLTLLLQETGTGLTGFLEYNTDLFNQATIIRTIQHYQTLIGEIVANPQSRLSAFSFLSEAERHQLLVEWNDTSRDYPAETCIHQLFAEQVERTPEAVAIVFEDRQLTYRELDQRANQLAHRLQALGVGPEVLVALCCERSIELVVGLLGILKAGGAYVPIDPAYPKQRIAFMLADAGAAVWLTLQSLAESLPQTDARVICLDADWHHLAGESDENVTSEVTAGNLAYVIYTSGSTGNPKGAMNRHGAVCNRLIWMADEYGIAEADRILQKTPFSFDVSVWEFFLPLISGARLVMARPGGHYDSDYLVRLVGEQAVTMLHFVPSMLQAFLDEPGAASISSVRHVICSGEALAINLQERFFERVQAKLHNLYGPTEAAVDVTYWACEPQSNRATVPIGRPIANASISILGSNDEVVPVGMAGQLHIGGVPVGRGYWRNPELSAQKFVPDPHSQVPGARLYRTGDLARYLPDGSIEYLGRIDHQVKVRGLRIELNEIEFHLAQHPGIKEAVVMAIEDAANNKRLVAYIVDSPEAKPSLTEMRAHLRETLPDYMVPSEFVIVDALPLSPNGKVDRRALAQLSGQRLEPETAYVAPQTELERTLAAMWQELLRVDRLGIHDNFFDLGGHSLLLVQLRSKLEDAFARSLSIVDLFQNPTVASLAVFLAEPPSQAPSFQPSARAVAKLKAGKRRLAQQFDQRQQITKRAASPRLDSEQ